MKSVLLAVAAVLTLGAGIANADAIKKFPDGEHGQGTENTRNGAGEVSQPNDGNRQANQG